MKVSEILDEIYLLVKDDSFFGTDEAKLAMIRRVNEAIIYACSYPGVEVPSLKRMGMFLTNPLEAFATVDGVSSSFSGRVLRAGEPGKVKIYSQLEDLYDDFYPLTKEGEVEAVCIAGNIAWYQGIPTEPTTIMCILQDDPPMVEREDEDIPVIPEAYQRRIIVHGVASFLYDNIEDGVDGAKVNTDNSKRELAIGIQKWMEFLGQRRQHNKTSHWRY
jgi:hypothetical protein